MCTNKARKSSKQCFCCFRKPVYGIEHNNMAFWSNYIFLSLIDFHIPIFLLKYFTFLCYFTGFYFKSSIHALRQSSRQKRLPSFLCCLKNFQKHKRIMHASNGMSAGGYGTTQVKVKQKRLLLTKLEVEDSWSSGDLASTLREWAVGSP